MSIKFSFLNDNTSKPWKQKLQTYFPSCHLQNIRPTKINAYMAVTWRGTTYTNLNEVSRCPDASISPCNAACFSAVTVGLQFKSFLYLPHYIHTSPYSIILCYYSTTLIIWTSILPIFNYPEQIFALIKIAIMHVASRCFKSSCTYWTCM